MCDHEGRECPGRTCRCVCMNCCFPEDAEQVYVAAGLSCQATISRFLSSVQGDSAHD